MPSSSYAIAIGSNRRGRHGSPAREVAAAIRLLDPLAASPIFETPALGPSKRRFANAVAIVASEDEPPALLRRLKAVERDFGRRGGVRWGARVLDLDIILWSQGVWADETVTVPHPEFRRRDFVLAPLMRVVPGWRDPVTGLSVRKLRARLQRRLRA